MPLKVRDALNLPRLSRCKILAGTGGLDNKITGVTIVDAPDGAEYLQGGEMVLSTLYLHRNDPLDLVDFVRMLHTNNCSVIGVKLRFLKNLPEQVKEFCNEVDQPILQIPEEKPWTDIINSVTKETLRPLRPQPLEDVSNLQQQFVSLVLRDQGVQSLAERLNQMLHRPVLIYQSLTEEIVSVGKHLKGTKKPWQPNKDEDAKPVIEHSQAIRISGEPESRRIAYRVGGIERPSGWIVISEKDNELEDEHFSILQHASTAVAFLLGTITDDLRRQLTMRDDWFLRSLLSGDFESEAEIQSIANERGLTIPKGYIPVIWGAFSKDSRREFLNELTGAELPEKSILGLTSSGEPCLLWAIKENLDSTDAEHSCVEEMQTILKDFDKASDNNLECGVGRSTENIIKLPEKFTEARWALKIRNALCLEDTINVSAFRQLGLYRLVRPESADQVQSFLHDTIGPLIKHDEQNESNLIGTLEQFLQSGNNYRATARALHMHYNSVRYRISQVEKICEVDLDSYEDRFKLEMACKLWSVRAVYCESSN